MAWTKAEQVKTLKAISGRRIQVSVRHAPLQPPARAGIESHAMKVPSSPVALAPSRHPSSRSAHRSQVLFHPLAHPNAGFGGPIEGGTGDVACKSALDLGVENPLDMNELVDAPLTRILLAGVLVLDEDDFFIADVASLPRCLASVLVVIRSQHLTLGHSRH
jgi:hypothetical protein